MGIKVIKYFNQFVGSDRGLTPVLFQIDKYSDDRGWFQERFKSSEILTDFVQDNMSLSKPGVIRGLHYQLGSRPQGKLVGCLKGEIYDVAVDIRNVESKGQWIGEVLDETKLLWIPEGFAHGFAVRGNQDALVYYKCTNEWSPDDEGGYRYDDPAFKIDWGIENPIISEKDLQLPLFKI